MSCIGNESVSYLCLNIRGKKERLREEQSFIDQMELKFYDFLPNQTV